MKILDIDKMTTVKRQVRIDGTLHDVHEVTVQQFIDSIEAAEKMEAEQAAVASGKAAADGEPLAVAVRNSAKSIVDSIPTLPLERVMKLSIPAMTALMSFCRAELDPEQEPAQAADAEAGEGGEGKKKPT